MDLLEAKSRIAEALVESVFRRARYEVQRYRPAQGPLRSGPTSSSSSRSIFGNNVEDHEELVHRIMGLLTSV